MDDAALFARRDQARKATPRDAEPNVTGDRVLPAGVRPMAVAEGLQPVRMEPPGIGSGLTPPRFTEGLEPLSEASLRGDPTIPVAAADRAEAEKLALARKRATDMGLLD